MVRLLSKMAIASIGNASRISLANRRAGHTGIYAGDLETLRSTFYLISL